MKKKSVPPVELTTARLKLRQLKATDAPAIFSGWTYDPEVARYLTWSPHKDVAATERVLQYWLNEYRKPDCIRYGIELIENGVLIGMIDVVGYSEGNPVVGYCLSRKYWNQGYMSEAFSSFIELLFDIGHRTIFIEAVKENTGSIRIIEKHGFVFLGCKEFALSPEKPEPVTIRAYRLDKSRYRRLKNGSITERIRKLLKG